MANNAHALDQTVYYEQFDLGLHYLLGHVCPNILVNTLIKYVPFRVHFLLFCFLFKHGIIIFVLLESSNSK